MFDFSINRNPYDNLELSSNSYEGQGDYEYYEDGIRIHPVSVTQFIQDCNDCFRYEFNGAVVDGEVAEFKTSQNKWVFFSLKDNQSTLNCFLPLSKLSVELEDGMKIRVQGCPKVTDWGKFSFTVRKITPLGEGSIRRAFERLKKKLEGEGLFDPSRKREIPKNPAKIGVISSTTAAGYADFCKILNARWGGLEVQTCHTQVQGFDAPDQIIRALNYLNEKAEVDVIAIIRGGGSRDDLSCFNDELLARAIASSRIPVITGIGHEVDESIADLAADFAASTPSNCAERLTSDRAEACRTIEQKRLHIRSRLLSSMSEIYNNNRNTLNSIKHEIDSNLARTEEKVIDLRRMLESSNPEKVLSRGYAILHGKISQGAKLQITTADQLIDAEVISVKNRN